MAATPYASNSLRSSGNVFDWQNNRFGPLGAVVLLHAGLFFALQYGLHDLPQAAAQASPKEMFASFIAAEQPSAVSAPKPQVMPLKPQPKPRPAPPKQIRKTVQVPAAIAAPTAPTAHAISTPQSHAAPDKSAAQEASASTAVAANAAAAPQAAQPAPAQPKTLSVGVEYLQPPQPRYPPLSRRMGEEGRAILRVLVNAQGVPERAEIRTSSGIARLDEAAREAVMRAQFRPHIDNGQAVAVFVIVPIRFQLNQ